MNVDELQSGGRPLHHGERCDRTEQLNTVKLIVRL